jgi:hypothetical protein
MGLSNIIWRDKIVEIQPPFMPVTVGVVDDNPQLCKLQKGEVIKIQYLAFHSTMSRRGYVYIAKTTDGDYIYDTGGHALHKQGDTYIKTYLLGKKEQSFYHIRKPFRLLIELLKYKR